MNLKKGIYFSTFWLSSLTAVNPNHNRASLDSILGRLEDIQKEAVLAAGAGLKASTEVNLGGKVIGGLRTGKLEGGRIVRSSPGSDHLGTREAFGSS